MNRNETVIKAVVFDMDGLMFNTEDLYDKVGQQILAKRGHDFSNELKLRMMGLPGPKAFAVMIKECDLSDTPAELQKEADGLFVDMLPEQIETMPGLLTLLEEIEKRNLPKAVATSSHRQFATRALGYFDLEPRFEFVLTGDDVENGKPNPDIYLLAAKKLGVAADEMIVLEDSHIGSRAAAAAGAFTIAVPTSHSRGQDFQHVNCVVDSLEDVLILQRIDSHPA